MKVLVVFSDPQGYDRLRLDREDKAITKLANLHADHVAVERLHASNIDDIREYIINQVYDVVQFSGHGSPEGIVLDKGDTSPGGELVSPERLKSLLRIADEPPKLLMLLSCYSNAALPVLAELAPFVITATGEIEDEVSLEFAKAFYEHYFTGERAIDTSYRRALKLLRAKNHRTESFNLARRRLLKKGDTQLVECTPDAKREPILVDVSAILDDIGKTGLSSEEFFHLMAKKLEIHFWIFDVPRERCMIPIGRKLLFGEFSWEDPRDVVRCERIVQLDASIPLAHWKVWTRLLLSYNDLASSEYRISEDPTDPKHKALLANAVDEFENAVRIRLEPATAILEELELTATLPYLAFVSAHVERAREQLDADSRERVVKALEEALTNYHDLVDAIRPPEAPRAEFR